LVNWSAKEEEVLRELYPIGVSLNEICLRLLNRSSRAIRHKASRMSIKRLKQYRKWTTEEEALLKRTYPSERKEEILKKFPGRTWVQIVSKCNHRGLGIKRKRVYRKSDWRPEELRLLRSLYPNQTRELILRNIPNRSWKAIAFKAQSLGLRKERELVIPSLRLSENDCVWLACALDSEGTIGMSKSGGQYVPHLQIGNTNRDFILHFKDTLKLRNKITAQESEGNYKTLYTIGTAKLGLIYALLPKLKPYTIIKKEQIDLILEFIEILKNTKRYYRAKKAYTSRQHEIYIRLRELNCRGRGD